MKFPRKSLLGFGALALLAAAAPTHAQTQQTFASTTASGANASNGFVYTSGVGGGFSTATNAVFTAQFLPASEFASPVAFNFGTGSLRNVGTVSGSGAVSDPFSQQLSGGSFTLTSGGSTLLSGTFGGGFLLSGVAGSSTSSLTNQVNNVQYTGGSYFTRSGLSLPGSFSISLTSVNPNISATAGYINSFVAGGTGTFSAAVGPAAVPEPGAWAGLIVGGLGLLALTAQRKRRIA